MEVVMKKVIAFMLLQYSVICFAQTMELAQIIGDWQGKISYQINNITYNSSLYLSLKSNGTFSYILSKEESGKYSVYDNHILLSFLDNSTITLNSVLIEDDSLSANITDSSCPVFIPTKVLLSRNSRVEEKNTPIDSENDKNIKNILEKYDLVLPLTVDYYNHRFEFYFSKKALYEIIKLYFPESYLNIYIQEGELILATNIDKTVLDKILSMVMKKTKYSIVHDDGWIYMSIGDINEQYLKSEFTNKNTINYGAIWHEIVNTIDSSDKMQIDPETEIISGNSRSVKTKKEILKVDNGYLYIVQLDISLKDISEKDKPNTYARITIVSNIIKRGLSDRKYMKVEINSTTSFGDSPTMYNEKVEEPYFAAILDRICFRIPNKTWGAK
jgi:hypothetical protein